MSRKTGVLYNKVFESVKLLVPNVAPHNMMTGKHIYNYYLCTTPT